MVQMWKPSSVAEVVKNTCYVEEHLDLRGKNIVISSTKNEVYGEASQMLGPYTTSVDPYYY